jgi:hypothetical protein
MAGSSGVPPSTKDAAAQPAIALRWGHRPPHEPGRSSKRLANREPPWAPSPIFLPVRLANRRAFRTDYRVGVRSCHGNAPMPARGTFFRGPRCRALGCVCGNRASGRTFSALANANSWCMTRWCRPFSMLVIGVLESPTRWLSSSWERSRCSRRSGTKVPKARYSIQIMLPHCRIMSLPMSRRQQTVSRAREWECRRLVASQRGSAGESLVISRSEAKRPCSNIFRRGRHTGLWCRR